MKNPFDDETILNVGALALQVGKRPSELFEWNDQSEWCERLMFDLYVIGRVLCQMKG